MNNNTAEPSKTRAQAAARRARAAGKLPPFGKCESCFGQATLHHHHSYKREHWLDVIPLCVGCHSSIHNGRRAEPRTGRWYATGQPSAAPSGCVSRLLLARMSALSIASATDLHRAMSPAPSPVAVRAWVAGSSAPKPKWWAALADALGLTAEALSEADRRDRLARAGGAA